MCEYGTKCFVLFFLFLFERERKGKRECYVAFRGGERFVLWSSPFCFPYSPRERGERKGEEVEIGGRREKNFLFGVGFALHFFSREYDMRGDRIGIIGTMRMFGEFLRAFLCGVLIGC